MISFLSMIWIGVELLIIDKEESFLLVHPLYALVACCNMFGIETLDK